MKMNIKLNEGIYRERVFKDVDRLAEMTSFRAGEESMKSIFKIHFNFSRLPYLILLQHDFSSYALRRLQPSE